MAWTQVISDTFTRANTSTGGAGTTTGAGNSWIDEAGGVYQISSDTLLGTTSSTSGYATQLLERPVGEAATGQRITATVVAGSPTAQIGLCLRGQTTVGSYYLFNYAPNVQQILVYAVVAGGPTGIIGGTSIGSPTTGHTLLLDAYVVGTSPTTVVFKVTDQTTSTVLANVTTTDSTTVLQAAGVPGLAVWAGTSGTYTANFTSATTYTGTPPTGGTFTISPTSIVGSSTGNTLTLTGSGTTFNSPSTSPFVLSGGLGAYLSAQSVTSATAATLTVNAGLYNGGETVTITDTNGGETATFTVTQPSLGVLKRGFIGDSIMAGTNGNPVAAFSSFLTALGYTVTTVNQAVSGTCSADWVVGDADGFLAGAISAFTTAGVTVVHYMLGTNDIRTPYNFTAATHTANVTNTVNALKAAGFQVIIHKPLYTVPNANFSGVLWPPSCEALYVAYYKSDIAALVDGSTVFEGDTANYAAAQQAPATFLAADGVHPAGSTQNTVTGQNWAIADLQRYGNAIGGGSSTPGFRPGFH